MTVQTNESTRSLPDAIHGLRFAMVATDGSDGIASRPLTLLEQDGNVLRFLVSCSADWVTSLRAGSAANAAMADPDKNHYASVTGSVRINTDRALIDRLWNPAAGVYFDGKDDPDIAVLELQASSGEYWEGPSSKVGQIIEMVTTKVRGETSLDEHGDISVNG